MEDLTKYLKIKKNVVIDIVEYDFESGVEASQYALVSCIGQMKEILKRRIGVKN